MMNTQSKIFFTIFTISILSSQINAAEHSKSTTKHSNYEAKFLIKEVQIAIVDNEEQHDFSDLKKEYVGKIIELNNLDTIEKKISEYFLKQGYLFPKISISQKNLNEGVLDIHVTPRIIGNVVVFSDSPDNKLIGEYTAKILENKHAKIDYIEKYITLMNRIPGYQVDHEFRPTKNSNELELILNITKSKADIFASIDSYGTNDLGQMENYVSGEFYDTKGGSDALSVSGSTTNHPDRLYSVSLGYITPINSLGTNLNFNASHSENNSTLQNNIHTTNGTDDSIGFDLNHLLYTDKRQSLETTFSGTYNSVIGYALNDDNGNSEDTSSKYTEASLSLKYRLFDDLHGNNIVNFKFSQGVSGRFVNYTDPTNVADKHYNIYQTDLVRDQRLPYNLSVYSHILAGHSNHALPSTEQYCLGGRDFGRGYTSGILAGDKIIAVSGEIRYNQEVDNNQWIQAVQPYVFRDFGYVGKQSSDTNISHISSYGGGVRFSIAFGIDIEGEVAQPMKKDYQVYGTPERSNTVYSGLISKSFSF